MKLTVLITGGTGGIGSACARRLAADGYPVAIMYHNDGEAAAALVQNIVQQGGRAEAFQCDVSDGKHVSEVVAEAEEHLGAIDTVIHAATAPLMSDGVREASWESYNQHLQVTLHGAVNVVHAVSPTMIEFKRGIFFFFLTEAMEHPPAGWSAYVAAKGALWQYARSLENELGRAGILVETFTPGFVDTPLTADLPDVFKRLARAQSSATTPEELAARISRRLSDIHH